MAKNQGPWGNNDNANPWGDNEETLNSPKVVDFSVLERIKKDDGFDFKIRWALLALLVIWLLSGFYQIQPSEQGVVLRFGAYAYTTDAGLHYHLPYPIESVEKVSITQERSITIGEAAYSSGSNSFTESHMLTGDENIVDINLTVVWAHQKCQRLPLQHAQPGHHRSGRRPVGSARNCRTVGNAADYHRRPRQS